MENPHASAKLARQQLEKSAKYARQGPAYHLDSNGKNDAPLGDAGNRRVAELSDGPFDGCITAILAQMTHDAKRLQAIFLVHAGNNIPERRKALADLLNSPWQ